MRRGNRTKSRLAAGEFVAAAWAGFGAPAVVEALLCSGWDTALVDAEHGLGGLEGLPDMLRAVEATGGDAVLRLPDHAESAIKRALDRGARSLMIPMVTSEEEAARLAAATRYPPHGRRGYAATMARASRFDHWTDYAERAHEETMLIAQIEDASGLAAVREIAAVDGVDMLFVGPNDLAGSLGIAGPERLSSPALREAFAEIEAAAREAGKWLGAIPTPGRGWAELKALGYGLVAGPSDIGLLTTSARAAAAARDEALGD